MGVGSSVEGLTEEALKRRLAARGAVVPDGRTVTDADAAARAADELGGPVMIKALVALKDRAKLGLVLRAEGGDAARAAAERLFARPGPPPVPAVLVERLAAPGDEYYLAAAFDHVRGEPVLLIGLGGSGVEHRDEKPRTVAVTMDGVVPAGSVPPVLEPVVTALLAEFFALRAQLVELNPVRVAGQTAVVLDAKAVLDPAVPTPADAIEVTPEDAVGAALRAEAEAMKGGTEVRFGRLDGDVGLVSAGGGVLAVVHDALRRRGLRPANFADVSGGSATTPLLGAVAREVVRLRPRGVLVVTGITSSVSVEEFANTMAVALAPLARLDPPPPIVARMAGTGEDQAALTLSVLPNCRTVGKDVTVDEAVDLLADLMEKV
jgi:succinyl-CoA synthetase beta subunit